MNKCTLLIISLLFSQTCFGVSIQDISKKDPAYSAIEQSITKGFLPLDNTLSFRPQEPIRRKELAVILNQVYSDIARSDTSLSANDFQQIKDISQRYAPSFQKFETSLDDIQKQNDIIQENHISLNHDVSKLTDSLTTEIATLKKERKWLYTIVGITSFLSIIK